MRVWQANLGRGVSELEFLRNLERVLDAAGPRAVIGLQEIDEADRPDEMAALVELASPTHVIVGRATAVPILIPRHLHLLGDEQTPACKGLALFTPNRVVNEAVVYLDGPDLDVAVLDLHVPLLRPQTLVRRRQCRQALRERTRAHSAGLWLADTNTHRGWPEIHPRERTVTDAGIDKAKAWAPHGWRVVVTERETVPLTIDGHDAHGARVTFEQVAA